MFYNTDSGLYLTQYRAYDPSAGRWLSRDPMGESSDPAGNLYPYANGNPVALTDGGGRFGVAAAIVAGAVVGGATGAVLDAVRQYSRNGGSFACFNGWEFAGAVGAGATLGATGGLIASEFFAAEEAEIATTTVGRWMSQSELDAMTATGRVQESFNNGVTSVTVPPNPSSYRAAPIGDVFTQFNVPTSSLRSVGNGTAKIYGPNSIFGPRLGITEMPPATNITVPQ